MKDFLEILKIKNAGIAWHTLSIMLHAFGFFALLGWLAGIHPFRAVVTVIFLVVTFYLGYYFELGYRTRRFEEFRYESTRSDNVKRYIKVTP